MTWLVSLLELLLSHGHPGLFLAYIEITTNTTGMGTPVVSVYKRYGAALFGRVVRLNLNPETKINPSNSTTVWHNSRVQHKLSKYGN